MDRLGGLDILVTNTGGPPSGRFEVLGEQDWRQAIDAVLMSVVRLCRAAIPHMRRRGGGRIIAITSVAVRQPVDGLILSNATRAAVVGLAKTLSSELAAEGILVNCVGSRLHADGSRRRALQGRRPPARGSSRTS